MATRIRPTTPPGEIIDTPAASESAGAVPWGVPVSGAQLPSPMLPASDDSGDELDISQRVRLLVEQFGGDSVTIKIYKRGLTGFEWVDDCSLSIFEEGGLTMLRSRFGAGKYELRIYGPQGLVARPKFAIAETAQRDEQKTEAGASSEMAQVLRMLAEGQNVILQAMASMRAASTRDPMEEMRAQFSLMREMREAMGIGAAPAPQASPASPLAALNDALALVRGLREASSELAPKEPESDSLLSLAKPLIEMVQAKMSPGASMQPLEMPSAFADNSAHQPQQPQPGTENPDMLKEMLISGAVQKLATMATNNAPHAQGGEFIARNLPDEMLSALELPNWFEILCEALPKHRAVLMQHRTWLEGAKAEADKLLQ